MEWQYSQPVRVIFGDGSLGRLTAELEALGLSRGLLVTSPSFVRRGLAARLVDDSRGLIGHIYSDVSPNPDVTQCDACADIIRRHGCGFVVALGGGSVLDCAKAAAAVAAADVPAAACLAGDAPLPAPLIPVIAVPTTAGTGSEVTSVAVLSDHARGIKAPLSSPALYPLLAIVDPTLTATLPSYITACSGLDALCHAVEAYWSRHHLPPCDALALSAAATILEWLPRAVADPSDAEARARMAEASLLAGLAFALPKTTSAHACSYPLTNRLGIPHGEACALTLTWFMRLNAARGCTRTAELAHHLGFPDAGALADAIDSLRERTGLRAGLAELRLPDDTVALLARESRHPNLLNNPVEISDADLADLYRHLCRPAD